MGPSRFLRFGMLWVICTTIALMTGCALPDPSTLESPTPMQGSKGKFLNPYLASGNLAPWADRGLHADRDMINVPGKVAAGVVGAVDPTGLASMGLESAVRQDAAVQAAGGIENMKATSETSFDRHEDFAVYLYVNHSRKPEYKSLTRFLAELYPDVAMNYDGDIRKAKKKTTTPADK